MLLFENESEAVYVGAVNPEAATVNAMLVFGRIVVCVGGFVRVMLGLEATAVNGYREIRRTGTSRYAAVILERNGKAMRMRKYTGISVAAHAKCTN